MVVFTAANRHAPQQMCPHGVSVAFVGAPKQMGQVYADRGSESRANCGSFAFGGRGLTGESDMSKTVARGEVVVGLVARALPFPLLL